ncbi:vascular-related unknown protein 4-like [Telopea speciosissima]|uniref:vascular-related unknown protein 4-like n=1 Tax=Telopea speciosissima TaxID=54955 RepID=UPI001CC4723B|nr:vascular-related unknown protein 4-like [Telopea speciosissima]
MENSMMSSINKSMSFKEEMDCPEESGWTEYFEDFMNVNGENNTSCCSSDFGTSSLVSDAASCAAWKFSHDHHHHQQVINGYSSMMGPHQSFKKLNFKKKIARKVLLDDNNDDLEDTASSPCNSPKVSELSPFHMNRIKREDGLESSNEKGIKQIDERNELGFIGTELKKRGLCLAPMSLLMNHLG